MIRRKATEWMLIMGMAACMITSCGNTRSNTPADEGVGKAENLQNESGGTAAAGNAGTQAQESGLSEAEAKKIAYDDAGGNAQNGNNGDLITEAAAVETALRDAGVEAADVSDLRTRLEREDGAQVYEVEFYVGAQEYEYEIDALDGTIRKKDMEIEDDFRSAAAASDTTGSAAGEEEAKKAALARVPGAGEDTIRIHQDTEDGRPVYEGKILYEGMEYEFEIDAATGEFRKWKEEPAHGD